MSSTLNNQGNPSSSSTISMNRVNIIQQHLTPNFTTTSQKMSEDFQTADICDKYPNDVQLILPYLKTYGKKSKFSGQAYTIKTHEDNGIVRASLEKPGNNRVLCIDGGGSWRCALVGDQLAKLVEKNQWAGVIVYGVIRDSDVINDMNVSIRALGTSPIKSIKREWGVDSIPIQFQHGPTIAPNDWIYADNDGILVSKKKLL